MLAGAAMAQVSSMPASRSKLTMRDQQDELHVLESSVFRGQLMDLLREGVVLGARA